MGEYKTYNEEMFGLGNTGSAIRELFEYGNRRKKEVGAENVFDYSLGNPSIPAPNIVSETLSDLIQNVNPTKLHGYTSAPGDINVRKAIAEYLNKTYGCCESFDRIYMTCGAAASLTISLHAILNEGEEVIVLAPFFPEYRVFVEKARGKLKTVKCKEDDFQIDLDAFKAAINANTKAVIINSPNNPTGVVFKEETLKRLAKILENKEKEYGHTIYIISDEPYRELVYSDTKVPFMTNIYDDTIVCYSFSKSLSLPGERIGYILVSSKCKESLNVFKSVCGAGRSLGFVCAPALFQYMVPKCLGYTSNLDDYKKNRELLYNALTSYGYKAAYPDGAFYLWVKALEDDANKFSEKAKKYDLLLVPSDSFGFTGYVRLAYCVSYEMIQRSLPAFKKLIEEYKK